MKNILMTGRPGSGKGTQANILSITVGVPHISTGEIFRDEMARKTELGLAITESMNAGQYTSDDITNEVIKARLAKYDASTGFILDGYPRTLNQAHFLEENGINIDLVINLDIHGRDATERLLSRTGREDDKLEVITKRMKLYDDTMSPVLDFYNDKTLHIDGNQSVEVISWEILQAYL